MRFRLNVFRQQGQVSLAARMIASAVPTLEQLGVPLAARDWMSRRQGLLLVTGPTGSGKSSTLAALIGHLNRTESRHIVTLEDPIEFLHPHGKSLVDRERSAVIPAASPAACAQRCARRRTLFSWERCAIPRRWPLP